MLVERVQVGIPAYPARHAEHLARDEKETLTAEAVSLEKDSKQRKEQREFRQEQQQPNADAGNDSGEEKKKLAPSVDIVA